MNLTLKQKAFVDQYLIDLNGAQAAIRAGYSEASAKEIAAENLTKPNVQAYLALCMRQRETRTMITQDKVIAELAKVAFGKMRNLMDWGPNGVQLKDSDDLTEDDTAMVAEISESTSLHGGSIKVRTYDKIKALELLGKNMGMFKDVTENNHLFSTPDGQPLNVTLKTVYVTAGERKPD